MPSLEVGLTPTQFDNILLEFLRDRGVKDLVNALEALRFMYTYWPAPSNNPAVRQQMIDVSFIVRVNLMVLIILIRSYQTNGPLRQVALLLDSRWLM